MMYEVYNQGRRVAFVPGLSVEEVQRGVLFGLGVKVVPKGYNFDEGDQEQPEEG